MSARRSVFRLCRRLSAVGRGGMGEELRMVTCAPQCAGTSLGRGEVGVGSWRDLQAVLEPHVRGRSGQPCAEPWPPRR